MNRIWKYEIEVGNTTLKIPRGAKALSVQVQHGKPCVWFAVDSDNTDEEREVVVIGTGQPVFAAQEFDYIGTFQLLDGDFVGHVFVER